MYLRIMVTRSVEDVRAYRRYPLRTSSAVSSAKMGSHRRNASKEDMVTVDKVYLKKRDTLL